MQTGKDSFPLFCTHLCTKLKLIGEIRYNEINAKSNNGFEKELDNLGINDELFEGLGCVKNVAYHINVDPNACPKHILPRRLPPALYEPVINQINSWEEDGIIRKSETAKWCSPLGSVRKPSGDIRLCVDYRELNKAILRKHRQIPSFEEIMHRLAGATVFSKLDAKSGYLQIPVTHLSLIHI